MNPRLPLCLSVVAFAAGLLASPSDRSAPRPTLPMPVIETNTATHRWLGKTVLDARLLDDMERTNAWSHRGFGRLEFTTDRCRDGRQSVRLVSPTKTDQPNPVVGRPFGECVARCGFAGEDWSGFNRLSFWVYPQLPGFRVISMLVKLHNSGPDPVPDSYQREGLHFFLLKPDQWNQVVWEIPHLSRDHVTAVEFIYRLQGHEPGAAEVVQFDVDRFELQRVDADPFEGWAVAPGRIAYSHSGYLPDQPKQALASGLGAREFRLVDVRSRKPVLTGPVATGSSALGAAAARRGGAGEADAAPGASLAAGSWQVLDFSEVTRPGRYYLEAGSVRTPAFPIGTDVWRDSIWKTLNLFHCERCGAAIAGIHGVCHQDWRATHRGETRFINGGWHDAGDLSQGLVNTAEATYAMLDLAQRRSTSDPTLSRRLIEEASWGLDWILKTRFDDGSRVTWATMDYWTDGQLGNADDTLGEVRISAHDSFIAAATEALAARVLKRTHPKLARHSLDVAIRDWRVSVDRLGPSPGLELASVGALASVELLRATQDTAYRDQAVEFARLILASQQREWSPWDRPSEGLWFEGFFYTSPKRDRILHYSHRGHEQAPIVALAALCEVAPEHPDWMAWYAAVALHSRYLSSLARFTLPYRMLPASIYSIEESDDPRFREQVLNGVKLDEQHYLRRFPVWFDFRGNSGTLLSQAKALSAAARLRHEADLDRLVQAQLQWHVGRNPFAQSLMFGEGLDYAPQYSAMSGDMVGSMPVGVQTRKNGDLPYWPAANCYNYKEVWVHPSSRWLWIMADAPQFRAPSPKGRPGLELRDISLTGLREAAATLEARVVGKGRHRVALRAHNLAIEGESEHPVRLRGEPTTVRWQVRPLNPNEPVVALVVPDGDLGRSRDFVSPHPPPKPTPSKP